MQSNIRIPLLPFSEFRSRLGVAWAYFLATTPWGHKDADSVLQDSFYLSFDPEKILAQRIAFVLCLYISWNLSGRKEE